MSKNGQRTKGAIKWFSDDLFVHKSGIRCECFCSLSDGDGIEFKVESGSDGRTKAADINIIRWIPYIVYHML